MTNVTISTQSAVRSVLLAACISALSLPALGATLSRRAPMAAAVVAKPVHDTARMLPPTLRPALYGALAKDAVPAYDVHPNGCATLPKQGLTACFDGHGVRFAGAAAPLSLRLAAWGRGNKRTPLSAVNPDINGNRVRYLHGNVDAWWRVLPVGFEQGFTIQKRPGGHGKLTLALAANGRAQQGVGTLSWGKLRYGKLVVIGANGKVAPAMLKTRGDRILIVVNDTDAIYPLTVDPLVWLEQKVVASDGAGSGSLGYSVDISGTIALIGAPDTTVNGNAHQGAAYVFTEAGGSWIQSAKLVANDGAAGDAFGNGVALDGTTALIGAPLAAVNGNAAQGAVYVFTQADGSWSQAAKLTASQVVDNNQFGTSVALDGTTALIGAIQLFAGGGAAYVFTDSNGTWTQAAMLSAADSLTFGDAVALDGTTALVGAQQTFADGNQDQGAAYVFTESDGDWIESAELFANDGASFDSFGSSVALDGNTALIGAPGATIAGEQKGAAYVFTGSGGNWYQDQKLVASDGAAQDGFGTAVALQGTSALIGAPQYYSNGTGMAYVFSDAGGSWSQVHKLTAGDGEAGDNFGHAVAFAGVTALMGASASNNFQGAAYFYNHLHVTQTDDDFESGNPNGWGWLNNNGSSGTINPTGGNPGAWFDSGSPYYSDHPNLSSIPSPGSPLRTALASGKVVAADYDFKRLDAGNCGPVYDLPSTFSLELIDTHSDPGGSIIEAYSTDGPPSPTGPSSWQTVAFKVPSSATSVPPNWVLLAPPNLNYTWQDLMHNLDGIRFFSINPGDITYDSCWRLGADNVKVTYRDVDIVTPRAAAHGSIAPNTLQPVNPGDTTSFVLAPDTGYGIGSVGGTCGGNLSGNTYTTDPVSADCTVEVSFNNAGTCAAGYIEFAGHLDAGGMFTSEPITVTEVGQKYADLTSPASFAFFAIVTTRYGQHTYVYPNVKHGHRWGAAGTYQVGVQAGPDAGGDYTLCVDLDPTQ